MTTIHNLASLALAISVALASSALASTCTMAATAPAASQLPGKGSIVSGHVSAGVIAGGQQVITIGTPGAQGPANAVIDWGTGAAINAGGAGGFNIGSAAGLTFADGSGHGAAVLNIDGSGNPSQIFGRLTGTGTSVFVANSNGIIVGNGARISSTAAIGLIANKTLGGTGSDFAGAGSIIYSGAGGDVTIARGASVDAPSVLIAGGGNVNVDLAALTGPSGSARLSAGMPSAAGSSSRNTSASLDTSGALASGVSLGGFDSAGSALNSGTLTLGNYHVGGLFTNTGRLTLPASNGAVYNKNQLTTTTAATFSALTNDGSYASKGVSVIGGDLLNNGKLWGVTLAVVDGNLINHGSLIGVYNIATRSDANRTAGADYSIDNTGSIISYGGLTIGANRSGRAPSHNDTTGSFRSTGTLRLASAHNLTIKARNAISLGGQLQTRSGTNVMDVNPYEAQATLGKIILSAGGYNAYASTPTFWTTGVLSVLTPLASTSGIVLNGRQVKLMSDVSVVSFASNGAVDPAGSVHVTAGGSMASRSDYAVIVGDGVTVSAQAITVSGPSYKVAPTDGRVVQPNVLLDGVLSASDAIDLGTVAAPISDVLAPESEDASGLILTGAAPKLGIAFTGNVGLANDYLPIDSFNADHLTLALQPLGYASHAGVANLLVDGNVLLTPPSYTHSPAIYGSGSATGPSSIPDTQLILRAAGNIATGSGAFYWPGAVYLGTIGRYESGQPATDILGDGSITLGGNFSNVLPGSIAGGQGITFMTASALRMGGHSVTTNADSAIDFGTDALTRRYATGELGKGLFFGGKQGKGSVVNYGTFDPSMFHTGTLAQ